MRCPVHKVALQFDERSLESVPDGLGPLGSERSHLVERWACPVADCGELEERAA
jgi:hypothetical protein